MTESSAAEFAAFCVSQTSPGASYSWHAADLSYITCQGPEEANLLCQPWQSNITITQTVRGEDYMVHHGMTAKDSERQHLLAAGTAGSLISELYTSSWFNFSYSGTIKFLYWVDTLLSGDIRGLSWDNCPYKWSTKQPIQLSSEAEDFDMEQNINPTCP